MRVATNLARMVYYSPRPSYFGASVSLTSTHNELMMVILVITPGGNLVDHGRRSFQNY